MKQSLEASSGSGLMLFNYVCAIIRPSRLVVYLMYLHFSSALVPVSAFVMGVRADPRTAQT